MAPRAGERGGELVFSGPLSEFRRDASSPTAEALSRPFPPLQDATPADHGAIEFTGVHARAFDGVDVSFPVRALTTVTGVWGSGKSTLVTGVLAQIAAGAARHIVGDDDDPVHSATSTGGSATDTDGFRVDEVRGIDAIKRLVHITQKPIGRTIRSTVATYTGDYLTTCASSSPPPQRQRTGT